MTSINKVLNMQHSQTGCVLYYPSLWLLLASEKAQDLSVNSSEILHCSTQPGVF